MKLLLVILLVLASTSFAKNKSGIYLNVSDYKNDVLTHESERTNAIHVHDFFWNMSTIKVDDNGEKYTYKKSSLYGYRNCKNEVFRFYNNMEYRIAEAGNIYIYTQQENTGQNKNNKVVTVYYFSISPDGAIIPLTLSNLKSAYKNNGKFIDLLDQFFSSGNVHAYDSLHNTFKANYVFSKTLKSDS